MQFLWQQKEDPVHGSGLQGSTVLFSGSVGLLALSRGPLVSVTRHHTRAFKELQPRR